MKNGWKRAGLIAGTIVAVGGAGAVLENYAPWAPKITFALATENTLARLDNQLITLLTLQAQAQNASDAAALARLRVLVLAKEREIENLQKLKVKHK